MPQSAPVERNWQRLTQDREFPISGVVSLALHLLVFGSLVFGVWGLLFDRHKRDALEIDWVVVPDPPGAGNNGSDSQLSLGVPTAQDVPEAIERTPVKFTSVAKDIQVAKPELVPPKLELDPSAEHTAPRPKSEIPQLAPLLKGLASGKSSKGDGGSGKGSGGIGKGTQGGGIGPDRVGTIRQQRQLRWTMLFTTRGAADYLTQLQALGVILGVQEQDKSIRMIRDLSRRPARAELSEPPSERIFWMDDDPRSVAAMAEELQLDSVPWRIIAFFPETVEQQLLQKELLYGRSFGRNSEDEIKETKFRVDLRSGLVHISVVGQR